MMQKKDTNLEIWREVVFKKPKLDGRLGGLYNAEHHNPATSSHNSQK